jgi:pyruvate,water dikinase
MNLIFTFQTPTPTIDQIGGKGLSLVRSAKNGFNVPPVVILSTEFFTKWIERIKSTSEWQSLTQTKGDALSAAANNLKKICQTLEFKEDQKQTLLDVSEFLQSEEISLMAVRSSSPEEDLEGVSFAGIYETVLGVNDSNLEEAIKSCFASALDARVFAYKEKNGFDPYDPKIAVVIQKQIASDISGVAFSLNPVSNDYDEAVINANFGLGVTIVDGTVTPDEFIVDKVTSMIIEKNAGNKDVAVYLKADGGIETKNLTDPIKISLSDDQITAITSLVTKIETEYDKPMDIEWAYEGDTLYLLQARPITGYYNLPQEMITKPGEPRRLYYDILLTEQGTVENLSSLGIGIWELMIFVTLDAKTVTKLIDIENGLYCGVGGRTYLNVSNTLKIPLGKSILKAVNQVDSIGSEILKNLDRKLYTPKKRPKGLLMSTIKLGVATFKKPLRILKALRKPADYLDFFLEENRKLEVEMREFFEENCSFYQNWSFDSFSRGIMKLNTEHMNYVSTAAVYATILSRSKIKKMFKEEPQSAQDQLAYIERSLPHNVTLEMGLMLYELSQFPEIIKTDNPSKFMQNLEQNKYSPEFIEKWRNFMDRYGFRYPKEIDVATPRYKERPAEVFTMMKTIGSELDPEFNPHVNFENGIKRREEAFEKLVAILEKKSKGKVKKFKKTYKVVKTFAAHREIPKYYIVMANYYIRLGALALGRRWVKEGRLDSVEQIFDLKYFEVVQAEIDPSLDIRTLAKSNHEYNAQFNTKLDPPVLIDSRGRILTLPTDTINENELIGTPVAPGIVKGPVKVLSRSDEKPILPGDILVTKATDPGWTMLYLNAAGVLLESGGKLQHGASVARESGKPCIVGVNRVTKILKDGQIVELNGSTGIIKIK